MFEFFGKGRAAQETGSVETKASAAGPVMAWSTHGRAAWSPRDAVSLTKSGFITNPIGFRATKLIAEAAAAIPMVLQDAERRFETHPILDLLARPNGGQGKAELDLFLRRFDAEVDEVPDPYYEGDQGFERVLDLIESACDLLVIELKGRL